MEMAEGQQQPEKVELHSELGGTRLLVAPVGVLPEDPDAGGPGQGEAVGGGESGGVQKEKAKRKNNVGQVALGEVQPVGADAGGSGRHHATGGVANSGNGGSQGAPEGGHLGNAYSRDVGDAGGDTVAVGSQQPVFRTPPSHTPSDQSEGQRGSRGAASSVGDTRGDTVAAVSQQPVFRTPPLHTGHQGTTTGGKGSGKVAWSTLRNRAVWGWAWFMQAELWMAEDAVENLSESEQQLWSQVAMEHRTDVVRWCGASASRMNALPAGSFKQWWKGDGGDSAGEREEEVRLHITDQPAVWVRMPNGQRWWCLGDTKWGTGESRIQVMAAKAVGLTGVEVGAEVHMEWKTLGKVWKGKVRVVEELDMAWRRVARQSIV